MAKSTKRKRRGSDTGDSGLPDHGPSKRARELSQPALHCHTRADRSFTDSTQDQVVRFSNDESPSQIDLENTQIHAARVSPEVQVASLCCSSPTGSDGQARTTRHLQTDNRSANAMLESNHKLPDSGDLRDLTEDDQETHHGPDSEIQRQATVTNTATREIPDSKEHTQVGYPTPPTYNEIYYEGTTRYVVPTQTPQACAPQEDIAVASNFCEQCNILAPHVPVSKALLTPREYEYEHVNENFGRDVCVAYEASLRRDAYREKKYGQQIASTWKPGSTPEDARKRWKFRAERNRAEAEEYSDSE